MHPLIDTIIQVFKNENKLSTELESELEQNINHYLNDNESLEPALRKAYRNYMDAEAPEGWVNVAERKLRAYASA